jgi:NAD(P)-dependent dehydrogenase (short-subunit alcohol dehydrogenase family)
MNRNSGKTAVVTGASSGIGRATAEILARAGFTVFGTSRKASNQSSNGVSMLACDVTDDTSVASLVSTVLGKTGRIDLLVNNAGIGLLGGAEESSVSQSQALFDVNLFGVMRMTHAVLPSMRRAKGASSISARSWAWSRHRIRPIIQPSSTRSKAIRNRSTTRYAPSTYAFRSSNRHSCAPCSTRTDSSPIPSCRTMMRRAQGSRHCFAT